MLYKIEEIGVIAIEYIKICYCNACRNKRLVLFWYGSRLRRSIKAMLSNMLILIIENPIAFFMNSFLCFT